MSLILDMKSQKQLRKSLELLRETELETDLGARTQQVHGVSEPTQVLKNTHIYRRGIKRRESSQVKRKFRSNRSPEDTMAAGGGAWSVSGRGSTPCPEVDHLIFSLQMCIVSWCWAPGFAGASDEQSRLNHPRGTEAAIELHISHSSPSLTSLPAAVGAHFILGLPGLCSREHFWSPVWPQGIGLEDLPLTLPVPFGPSPSLKVLILGPFFFLRPLPRLPLHTPAGAPSALLLPLHPQSCW